MKETGFWQDGDNYIERRSQDIEPIIETVKTLQNANAFGSSEMRHAAKIPTSVIENYIKANGIKFEEFMANPEIHGPRLLNDPALAGFRIWKGRV
jgi:hypothetical protein